MRNYMLVALDNNTGAYVCTCVLTDKLSKINASVVNHILHSVNQDGLYAHSEYKITKECDETITVLHDTAENRAVLGCIEETTCFTC